MSATGLLVKESLADLSVLDQLNVTKVERWEPGEAGAPGPHVWTATYFDGDEAHADKVFRYRRGDVIARTAPEDHARSKGVPEHQLDWERDG